MAIAPAGTAFGTVPTTGRAGTGNPTAPPTTRGGYTSTAAPTTAGPSMPPQPTTSQYYTALEAAMPGPRPSDLNNPGSQGRLNADAWFSMYDTLAGPQKAWLEKQNADLAARQGMVAAKYGAVSGAARRGYDADSRLLDNQEQQHFVDVAAAARQPSLLDALYGVQTDRFGVARDRLGNERGYLGQQRGFAGRTRDLANRGAELDYSRQVRMANDDFAARGAFGASGYGDTMREFGEGRDISRGRASLGYDSDIAGIDNRLGSLDLDERGIGLDERQAKLQYDEDKAKAADRIKTLDLVSESFGIRRDQLKAALDRSIAENGLGEFTSSNQILDMMASNNRDQMMIAENVIRNAISGAQSGIAPPSIGR